MTPKAQFSPAPRTVRAPLETDAFGMSTGTLLLGDPGGGKTTIGKVLAGDAMDRGDPFVWLDFSGGEDLQWIEWRASKIPDYPVQFIDLHDTESWRLRLKTFINTETKRLYYAKAKFPDIKGDQSPYFNLNARDVYYSDLCVLDWFGGEPEEADAIRLSYNPPLLGRLADQIPHLGDPIKRFGDTKSAHDVMSTVRMRLAAERPLAALALKVPKERTIDIENLRGATVLVVRDRDAVVSGRMASMFVDFVADFRLDTPRQDLLWLFLDEFRQADPLRTISALLRRGRKSRTNVVMMAHSIHGIIDRYGPDVSRELFALAARKIALRTSCVDTCRMLSDAFGVLEQVIDVLPPPGEKGVRRERQERANVSVDEIRRCPLPSVKDDRITGWYDGPDATYRFTMPFLRDTTPDKGWKPRVVKRRPAVDEILPPFTSRDFDRLKFPTNLSLGDFL